MNFTELLDLSVFSDIFHYQALVYIILAFIVFFIGKWIYDLLTPFKLNEQLVQEDNKALAVSFCGYLAALGIIIWSVVNDDAQTESFFMDLLQTLIWSCIGIILLQISRLINDKIILYQFDNLKEIIKDKNIGTGVVELGTYIGSALIISAVVTGEESSLVTGIVECIIFFVMAQLLFIIFGVVYQFITSYDLHKEIERDNISAGLSFSLSLIAISLLISDFIKRSSSLPGLVAWFIICTVLLMIARILVDKLILPGSALDHEIEKDQNWGAALIEGGVAISLAFLITAAY